MKKKSFCLIFIFLTVIIFSLFISFATDDLSVDKWMLDVYLLNEVVDSLVVPIVFKVYKKDTVEDSTMSFCWHILN